MTSAQRLPDQQPLFFAMARRLRCVVTSLMIVLALALTGCESSTRTSDRDGDRMNESNPFSPSPWVDY
jgi:hypothetical protein